MTINEIKKELQDIQKLNPELIEDDFINSVIKVCDEYQQYRSLDLVNREDVLQAIEKTVYFSKDLFFAINEIPKAELVKELL